MRRETIGILILRTLDASCDVHTGIEGEGRGIQAVLQVRAQRRRRGPVPASVSGERNRFVSPVTTPRSLGMCAEPLVHNAANLSIGGKHSRDENAVEVSGHCCRYRFRYRGDQGGANHPRRYRLTAIRPNVCASQ